jgi:NAD(P)H-dependent flavin oxidoreductase YrpB (nitropropane dioxygenase family)
MRAAIFKTRITELLGIRHPILCGGMGPGISDARYVAAVVNAGGMSFIVASGFPDPERFREELHACRALTGGKPFGVNLYISHRAGGAERLEQQIQILIEEKVHCVETAGANPGPLIPRLQEAGIIVIHKMPAVKYALSAERSGADAVIVVGNDCGGHPGIFGIGSIVQGAHAPQVLGIPVVIGGGIGCGRQMTAMLAMGAEGICMGTRMMVAEEIWVHRDYKEFMVKADGTESVVVKKAIRDHHRVLNNDSAKAVVVLDNANITDFEQFRPHVMGSTTSEAYRSGDVSRGMIDFGPAAIFADKIQSVEAIFDEMIDDASAALGRLQQISIAA